MEFWYATTESESDWSEWIIDNTNIQNGKLRLATEKSVQKAEISSRLLDHDIGPNGDLYTIGTAGGVFRYNSETETRERLLKRSASSIQYPSAICASPRRVFVADASDGTIVAISPEFRREIGKLRSELTNPTDLMYANSTIYAFEDGELLSIDQNGTVETFLEAYQLGDPIDTTVRDDVVYTLDGNSGEPVVRAFREGNEIRNESFPLPAQRSIGGKQFTPKCLSAPEDKPVVAGAIEDENKHALFEFDEKSGGFKQYQEINSRPLELVGRTLDETRRTFYLLSGVDRTCHAYEEVREFATHQRRDRHIGAGIQQYDSGVDGMDWHRVSLDVARSSASTQIHLRYTATDTPGLFELDADRVGGLTAKEVETLRKSDVETLWELATVDPARLASTSLTISQEKATQWKQIGRRAVAKRTTSKWTSVDVDTTDVLLEDATGRYLFVAIELVGTPNNSPVIDSVQAFCPQKSYLRYLPSIYQDSDHSAAFLRRYLSVFETAFVDIEQKIESISTLFDPEGAPSESLSWLEGWLAADPGKNWPESARRELLSRAPELYKKRGTKAGLFEMIDLYLRHANPEYESASDRLFLFQHRDLDHIDSDDIREHYAHFLSGNRSFVMFCDAIETQQQREAVQNIVNTERPAHVDGTAVALESTFSLGDNTFLGLNSRLNTRDFNVGDAALGIETVLTPQDAT